MGKVSKVAAALAAVFLMIAMSLVGCTKKSSDLQIDLGNGTLSLPLSETLRVNLGTEPPTLDWNKSTDTSSNEMIYNLMDGLTRYDVNDNKLELAPGLAVKWEPLDKARRWRVTLRQGVKWSDGVDFTAQQVADSLKRLLSPELASEFASVMYSIKNAREFNEGKVKDFAQVGLKIVGPSELEFELVQPIIFFPYLLASTAVYPVRLDLISKYGDKWTEAGHLQTLGPFKLKAWQHDKVIVMERNDGYWGEKPKFKYLVVYMVSEQTTALSLFDSGKLDALHALPSIELATLKKRDEFKQIPSYRLYYFGINVTAAPMTDARIRRAVSLAINRKEIVDMLGGGQTPLTSWIPTGLFAYQPDLGLGFDIEKAKSLLKEAGYTDLSKIPQITLAFNTNEDHQRIAENIQAQLKRNLGLKVELKNQEWKVYLGTLSNDPPPIFRLGWQAEFADPHTFMNMMTGYSDNNRTRWKNPAYDELVEKAAGEADSTQRARFYSEAQKILVEQDVPVIPIYSGVEQVLVGKRIENYPVNALGRYDYRGVRIK